MNKLYIVRHGKTDWNNKGIIQGRTDTELNKEGLRQVKKLSRKIDLNNIDICICSPLKRTKETAKIITNGKVPIIYDDLLVERGFGDIEGHEISFELLKKALDYNLNYSEDNIENLHDCLKRANTFLTKINKEYRNKKILIVSHGAFIKCLHYNLIGYDKNTDFLSFNPQNAIIYEYELKSEE